MRQVIGIINYPHAGNIFNIVKAVSNFDVDIVLVKNANDFTTINRLIIPGVGTYQNGMKNISHLKESIIDFSRQGYILGICLGMQLLSTTGSECGSTIGLELVDGEVLKMQAENILPHVGWNKINIINNSKIFKGCESNFYYFMHSYEYVNIGDYENVTSLCSYKNYQFISSIEKENIYGVQFHPEKSRESGLQLLKNFIEVEC